MKILLVHILLIRHGQTDYYKSNIIMGDSPVSLNEQGKLQALLCSNFLSNNFSKISRIYSSSLLRAQQTAEIIHKELNRSDKINYVDSLTERSFGEFSGLSYEELKKKLLNSKGLIDTNFRPEDGESYQDFYSRVTKGFTEIIKSKKWNDDETIVIISHGGTIKHILGFLLLDNKNSYNYFPVDVENCSITSLNIITKSDLETTVNFINFYQYLLK